ncbi:MAG: cyclic nucleotide-binding domain-containing protein [Chitinophagaceae bacterium]
MDTAPAIEQLRKYLSNIHALPPALLDELLGIWQPFTAKRKTMLTRAGETENYLYFVTEGVQRAFYLHNNDKEATIVFTYPFSFSGVADSFLSRMPSAVFLETLTSSSFLRTTHAQVDELMKKHPAIMNLFFKATAFAFAGVLERQIELQCFSAEEKFRVLLKRSPHVLQLIPHKYLASYLALDASTFSKLLSSVKI